MPKLVENTSRVDQMGSQPDGGDLGKLVNIFVERASPGIDEPGGPLAGLNLSLLSNDLPRK